MRFFYNWKSWFHHETHNVSNSFRTFCKDVQLCTLWFATGLALALQIVEAVLVCLVVWLSNKTFLAGLIFLAFLIWIKGGYACILFLVRLLNLNPWNVTKQQLHLQLCWVTQPIQWSSPNLWHDEGFCKSPSKTEWVNLLWVYSLVQGPDCAGIDPWLI